LGECGERMEIIIGRKPGIGHGNERKNERIRRKKMNPRIMG